MWQAGGRWLAGFRWQAYMIGTFAQRPHPETVQRAVEAWYAELRQKYPRVFAYCSVDRGAATGHWNVHILLGGLFTNRPPAEPHYGLALQVAVETAKRSWRRGQVPRAVRYDPRGGMVSYMTQPTTWAEPEVPGMFLGTPIRKRHGR